jgi:hypothetical protein
VATSRTADLAGTMRPAAALTAGFQRAFAVGAGFALVGALMSLLLLVRTPARPEIASSGARESA